jgi:hypothetical protein
MTTNSNTLGKQALTFLFHFDIILIRLLAYQTKKKIEIQRD